jgi:hypothetical protein
VTRTEGKGGRTGAHVAMKKTPSHLGVVSSMPSVPGELHVTCSHRRHRVTSPLQGGSRPMRRRIRRSDGLGRADALTAPHADWAIVKC